MKIKELTIFVLTLGMALMHALPGLSQQDTTRIQIDRVEIRGNITLSKKAIEKIVPPGRYTRQQIEQAIGQLLRLYQQQGHYFARIESDDADRSLRLSVDEGSRLMLSDIQVSSRDSIIHQAIASRLDIRNRRSPGEAINFNTKQALIYLENNGYPFGKISIDSLIILPEKDGDNLQLSCYLGLERGPLVTIDTVLVRGNTLTRRDVIVREMRVKQGEIYRQKQIDRSRNRLLRSGLFDQVDAPEIFIDRQGTGYLIVNIKEGTPNQLNAVVGYNPAINSSQKGYLTGLIDVGFKNLLGTGRVVEAYWQKKDRRSQKLRFHYVEPWIAGYPVDAGAGFQQAIQDTSFIRRSLFLEIDFPFSDVLTIQSHFATEAVLPDSIGQILYQLPQGNSWLAKIGFSYDTRNDPWNPSRGAWYRTQYEYARKRVSDAPFVAKDSFEPGTFRRDRWILDLEVYVPTFRWQTVMLGLHGRQVKSTETFIPISDLFRFGGTGSLRGYREDEFWGEKVAWLNLEYRYLLASRSRIFLFFDSGYYLRKDREQQVIKDYKVGYGFGLRIETRLGVVGIDYGLGQGRSLTGGLVHVRLTNKF